MYKYSVPVSFTSMNEETRPKFAEIFKESKIDRVFLCVGDPIPGVTFLRENEEKVKDDIAYFKSQGFEVGVWINAFGHGGPLSHDVNGLDTSDDFTKLEGVDVKNEYSYCPLDEKFAELYATALKLIAKASPSLIMLDDDYRLNYRSYRMGCACPLHMNEYYKRIGEVIPKEELERKVFSGGKNFYRTEWLKLMGETLVNFAKKMREEVNKVDSSVRLGICQCWDTWDAEGTDGIEIANAFAGDTKPFLRTIGAPYHGVTIPLTIETNRLEAHWAKTNGIEVFCEGDVYPRPRYKVPARKLEIYDLALLASGETDGILKYMFDYNRPVEYECGYHERHIKNEGLRTEVKEIFVDKQATGIYVVDEMRKMENWHLPEETPEGVSTYLIRAMETARDAKSILANNAVPTTYKNNGEPLFIMGENAWYVDEENLKNGAVLDVSAAKILCERGIDTGLVSAKKTPCIGETFLKENEDMISGLDGMELYEVACSDKAEVETVFVPSNTPGSYRYENANGQRFFVLACSLMGEECVVPKENTNYTVNYYRKAQMISAIEWVSGKKLAAKTIAKCPDLYTIVSENTDKTALSVAVVNSFIDDAYDIEFTLGKEYSSVRFVGCEGIFDGNTVKINYMEPYSFAAFEVKE